jgi:hypothetical protein
MCARITFRGLSTLARLGAGSAVTVLVLSSCGGYGGGSNYMAPSSTGGGGVTCGGGAYSNPCPAPTVSISGPAANDTLSGMVMLTASASAMDGLTISKVEYFVDGSTAIGTATTSPYSVSWDSTKVSNGAHTLTAMATDDFMGSPNSATSAPVMVMVQNPAMAAVPMSPMQVFPAPSSSASGMARIEVQPDTAVAHASVSLKGLNATAVTINEGFAGETGPVLLRLTPRAGASGEWELPGTTMLSAEQLQALRQGRLYAIASSAAHPAGEIRGQLTPANVTVRFAELAPNAEARALGIKGSGIAAATVDTAARTLTVHVNSGGVDDAMTAQAATRALTKDAVSLGHWSTERASLRDSDLEDFAAGRWSVSIAIPEEPDAAIAGTIRPASPATARTAALERAAASE